jgi:ATP-dependent helicase/nuclease subunit B
MIRIHYGRECVDKEAFLFGEIARTLSSIGEDGKPERVFLLVPDQYTLQAERNALTYLGKRGFMDLEILSQGRLANRVLDETGGGHQVHIDKNGRHMLLSGILSELDGSLSVFRGMWRSQAFINMANDLISEMKQYDVTPEGLSGIIKELGPDTLLGRKLADIQLIFSSYEERIRGKYIDTEDFLERFIDSIRQSSMLRTTEIWIFGFDFFSPKMRKIIGRLAECAKEIDLVLTADDRSEDQELFRLTQTMMNKLEASAPGTIAERAQLFCQQVDRAEVVAHIERELFSMKPRIFEGDSSQLTLCRAANFYAEVETAAAYICRLVREEGMRYRDIAVICNDMEGIGPIIQRVFAEYEIPLFLDRKRKILHDPAIVFVSALLDVIADGWRYEDIFRLLKTGLCPVDTDEWETLENYAIRYRLRKSHWKKEFQYGKRDFGEDGLENCNRSRAALVGFVGELESALRKAKTGKDKVKEIHRFLTGTADLPGKIRALADTVEEGGFFAAAQEMRQIWEAIEGLLLQLDELLGEEAIDEAELAVMLKAGFASFEIGVIPPTVDQVVAGAMQRIRIGRIKTLVIIGANDGILPGKPSGDDLLSQDERARLLSRDVELCKDDDLRMMEEQLAIYKNLSKPETYLFIGCSSADSEGKELRPSILFERLRRMFPNAVVEKDLRNQEDPLLLVERPAGTLKHLTEALRNTYTGAGEIPPPMRAAYNWYEEQSDPGISMVKQGIVFDNRLDKLESSLTKKLFQRSDREHLTISPSRLERFGRCPFAHLVLYGFRPEERRVFEVAGREAGDAYHECLMRFSQWLTIEGIPLAAEGSPWLVVTKEDAQAKIDEIMEQIAVEYQEGVLVSGAAERYRSGRMKEICGKAAWAMVEHVRQGKIREVFFEESFGEDPEKTFPPIVIRAKDQEIRIEGKIDRLDLLEGDYVKVIDYKSGKESFDAREAVGGWRLQLMLYLKAAMEGFAAMGQPVKPAGIFYFEISDDLVDASAISQAELGEKLSTELKKAFKMDGILLNDPLVVDGIAGDFDGPSEIVPIRKNKDGKVSGTTEAKLLTEEAFLDLRRAFDETIKALCTSLASGTIDVHPKKTKYQTACTYCDYKSICAFELSFDGCSYDVVK